MYAFEANPDTYKRLEINSHRYGFEAFNYAISDKEGNLKFLHGTVLHTFTTVENASGYHYENKSTTQILYKRLDSFGFAGNSLIIKIDGEGQELEALIGAGNLVKENPDKGRLLRQIFQKGRSC